MTRRLDLGSLVRARAARQLLSTESIRNDSQQIRRACLSSSSAANSRSGILKNSRATPAWFSVLEAPTSVHNSEGCLPSKSNSILKRILTGFEKCLASRKAWLTTQLVCRRLKKRRAELNRAVLNYQKELEKWVRLPKK